MLAAPRSLRASILTAALAGTMLHAARAEDGPPANPEPESEVAAPQGAAGCGGEGGVSGLSVQFPQPPLTSPQPNLRHATTDYQVTFAVSAADAAVIKLLDKPLGEGGIPFLENAPLHAVGTWLAKNHKAPVRIDARSLEDAGLDIDVPLPMPSLTSGSLGAALRAILDPVELAVTVEHESIVLTTREHADERLFVGVYPLPTQVSDGNFQPLIDVMQSTIAAETWDTVGGMGAIRVVEEANELVISQTLDVHLELMAFMRTAFDTDLVREPGSAPGQIPTRVHRLHDRATAKELADHLADWCNAALGKAGDPDAKVTLFANDRVIIQSTSRPFHVYAAEMIRALDGLSADNDRTVPGMGTSGGMSAGNPFCWVAREVYGPNNPRWIIFRGWLLTDAPAWLRNTYMTHGERFASWLHGRPVAKAAVRVLMDAALAHRGTH